MTLEEAKKLVTFVASADGRRVNSGVIHAWHQSLGSCTYDEAKAAATTALRNSGRDYITVGDVMTVLRGEALRHKYDRRQECPHGVVKTTGVEFYCHDCSHRPGCPQCKPTPKPNDDDDEVEILF